MQRLIYLIAFIFCFNITSASHLFGGEITWKCVGNQFEFTLKVYRDCSGIPLGSTGVTSILVWGHPSVCTISLNPGTSVDLSPSGCGYNCSGNDPRSVEEWTFVSNPVTLAGVPPSTGWIFEWNSCCRNPLDNIGGIGGFSVRSIMYPYTGLNTNPCFDSSPYFTEKPHTLNCIGAPAIFSQSAVDPDCDSLVYNFGNPLGEPTNVCPSAFNAPILPFIAPYTVASPVPGSPVIDSKKGVISLFDTATTGNFGMNIKVASYKCGIKVAEVYRDYILTFINGCTVQGGGINSAPIINPPFNSSTLWDTTVCVGDTVRFLLQATDFQSPPGGGVQSVIINATGEMFGTNFLDTNSGCTIPPCAVLNKTLPNASPILNNVEFFWTPTINHFPLPGSCCQPYYCFYFKVSDDFCPAPAFIEVPLCIRLVNCAVGITENNFLNDIKIIPNPSSGFFRLRINSHPISTVLIVQNLYREKLKSFTFTDKQVDIDLSTFAKGIYFVELKTENATAVKKIIIQ